MSITSAMKQMFSGTEIEKAPATAEKDEAIAIARRILSSGGAVGTTEAQILARQLLRVLALRVVP